MKRNLLLAVATSSILALAAPSLALAQGRHHHHGARHASSHNRHGHRAHLLTFGGSLTGSSGAPTTPTPSSGAATVVSFTAETLTIELTSDKSLVKGKVTARTEIECQPAPGTGQGSDDDQPQTGGEDQDQSEGGDDGSSQTQSSDQNGPVAHSSDVGDDQGEEEDQAGTCTTADLKPGAVVLRAELIIGNNGPVWEKIELQK